MGKYTVIPGFGSLRGGERNVRGMKEAGPNPLGGCVGATGGQRSALSRSEHKPKVGCHKAKLEMLKVPQTERVLLRRWGCTLKMARKLLIVFKPWARA